MKIKFTFFFSFFVFFSLSTNAQSLVGKTQNSKGETVPFVSIYTENFTASTSSNATGFFELKLAKGEHTLVFKMMGYETLRKKIEIGETKTNINIRLKEQLVLLKEVEVSGKQEDPAYAIMRQAIAHRAYFEKVFSLIIYTRPISKIM